MYTDFDRFHELCAPFIDEGYITGFSRVISKGKEATVLCCDGDPSIGADVLALKIYKDSEFRNFKNDAPYLRGKVWDKRLLKRMKIVKHGVWVDSEYATLKLLHQSGVRVPQPYLHIGNGILMEYVSQDGIDAPALKGVRLEEHEARRIYEDVITGIGTMLACDLVHGDLSSYNLLYDGSNAIFIDFPQSVQVASYGDAFPLLLRDIENIHSYFSGYGIKADSFDIARDLWSRYQYPI